MKEFDIYLLPRLTECDVYVYSLPYYSTIAVMSGMILQSSVGRYTLRKGVGVPHGLTITSKVEGTFKRGYEEVSHGLMVASDPRIVGLYKIWPSASGILLDTGVERLSSQILLTPESGMVLGAGEVPIKIIHPMGSAESELVIQSDVGYILKRDFLDGVTPGLLLASEAEAVQFFSGMPEENSIILDAGKFACTLQKMTAGTDALLLVSEGEGILSHSLGRMESELILDSSAPVLSKGGFLSLDGSMILDGAALETERANRFSAENELLLLPELKNLCYLILLSGESGLVIDTEGTGTLKKVLYGAESGMVFQSGSAEHLDKAIDIDGGLILDSEGACTLNKAIAPEETGVVIRPEEAGADLKRCRLLSEMDNLTLADLDDRTLDELDYVWLT